MIVSQLLAVEFDQVCIKPQLRRAEANQFLEEPDEGNSSRRRLGRHAPRHIRTLKVLLLGLMQTEFCR